MPASSDRTTPDSMPRCLLLTPRGPQPPAELVNGLEQRGVTIAQATDVPAVMVALARQSFVTLVIVEPSLWKNCQELVRAVRRYHPAVALWQYIGERTPRLSRYPLPPAHSEPRSNSGNGRHATPAPRAATSHTPRLDIAPPTAEDAGHDAGSRRYAELSSSDLRLSEEELAMLLGDDDENENENWTAEPEGR